MHKETITKVVRINHIGDVQHFKRSDKRDFSIAMVDVESHDGQKLFCEVRNVNIPLLVNFKKDDVVEIDFFFAGSEKNGKKYNNCVIVDMRLK